MRVGIFGLGLIGGSLGLDLRDRGHRVIGVTRQSETAHLSIAIGATDEAGVEVGRLAGCEVIFLCTPMQALGTGIAAVAAAVGPETILTDVASVKGAVVGPAEALWPRFVGGHPMAGGSEQGITAASRGLFVGRPYVLTPTATTDAVALERVRLLIRELGARLIEMTVEDHDRAVARISHLPVMVSAALLLNLADDQTATRLASSGFYDTTRVGGGNPQLGLAMAQLNREAMLAELASYRAALERLEGAVQTEDWTGLEASLEASRRARVRVFPQKP